MTPSSKTTRIVLTIFFAIGTLCTAHATSGLLNRFNSTYGTSGTVLNSCSTCHTANIPGLNPYGRAESNASDNFPAVENLDSDGDGFTNIQEIMALTFPGDPASRPSGGPPTDTMPPVVTAFLIPSDSASLTVPITSLMATDDVGVTGYMLSLSSAPPSANAPGWVSSAPNSFTFAAQGMQTLWAWAKDAAGNVSAGVSASTTITVSGGGGGGPDNTPPVITSFTLPATASSRTVQILSLIASDDVGVTGYVVTASSRRPRARSSRWSVNPPTTFTFRGRARGSVTLSAWARDAAGNVSSAARAVTIIGAGGGGGDDDDDTGDDDDDGGSEGSDDDSSEGTNTGGSGEAGDDAPVNPPAVRDTDSAVNHGADAIVGMEAWVSRWMAVSIRTSAASNPDDGYLKIQSWNSDAGLIQTTLFTRDPQSGQWQSVDLELRVNGGPLKFLASFEHAGEFEFAASFIAAGDASNLQSASLQAIGVSHSQHLDVTNGRSETVRAITLSGALVPDSGVPAQILH